MPVPVFSVGEVLTAANMNAVGLWRVTTCTVSSVGGTAATASNGVVTIGSGNTSVTVSNAFSADFDHYRIILAGGSGSNASGMSFKLGSSGSGYYSAQAYVTYAADGVGGYVRDNNAATWQNIGGSFPNGLALDITLFNPFSSTLRTGLAINSRVDYRTDGAGSLVGNGYHNSAASYSSFTISPGVGSMTGGTLRVYGFRN